MYSPTTALAAIGLAFGLAGGVIFLPALQRPFMTVHAINMDAQGIVTPDRTIHFDPNITDWRVTVVSSDGEAPSCQTITGPELHQGWSKYRPGQEVEPMTLDVWVGDPGCWGRLPPGSDVEYTTWTPRDGSPAVTWRRDFVKR